MTTQRPVDIGRRRPFALGAVGLVLGSAAVFVVVRASDREPARGVDATAPDAATGRNEGPVLAGPSEEAQRAHRARAVGRWQEGIAAEDAAVRLAAVSGWEKSGLAREQVATELVPLLADWKPDVRKAARQAFLGLGASGVEALVRDGLGSSDLEVPTLSIEVLGEIAASGGIESAVAPLVEILGNPVRNRAWRERAATALGRVRPSEQGVQDALVRAALDPSDDVAISAIEALGMLGTAGEPHVPFLIQRLDDDERGTLHTQVLASLAAIARRPDAVIPAVFRRVDRVQRPHPQGSDTIVAFGKASEPHLAANLASESPFRRELALQATRRLAEIPASLADDLVAVLRRDDEGFRPASDVLLRIGPAAAPVVPDLVKLLDGDPETRNRPRILEVLTGLGPDGRAALRALLKSRDAGLRTGSIQALAAAGDLDADTREAATPVIPDLMRLVDVDPETRPRVLEVLARLGPEGRAALLALLKSRDAGLRMGSVQMLAAAGGVDDETRAKIVELAEKDPDEDVRRAATWALQRFAAR